MPSDTLWQLETQTEGKHLVLKYYLDGCFPYSEGGTVTFYT